MAILIAAGLTADARADTDSTTSSLDGALVSVGGGLALPGDLNKDYEEKPSPIVFGRFGYAVSKGRMLVTPAVRVELGHWLNALTDTTYESFHIGPEVRLALQGSVVRPYVTLGVGLELVDVGDRVAHGGGLHADAGLEIPLGRLILDLGATLHPGFTVLYGDDGNMLSYLAFSVAVAYRFD